MQKRKKLLAIISLFLIFVPFLIQCGDNAQMHEKREEIIWQNPQLPQKLTIGFESWAKEVGIYGGAAQIVVPNKFAWQQAYGYENIKILTPFHLNNCARVASITKIFTAIVIMQLIEENKIYLDQSLSDFLPDFPNSHGITIEHLLAHRSGLRDIHLEDGLFLGTVLLKGSKKWWKIEEVLKWASALPFLFNIKTLKFEPRDFVARPGEIFNYTQMGYLALGYIIEKVTEKTVAQNFQERIADRLELYNTILPAENDPPYPMGYTNFFGIFKNPIHGSVLWPSANNMVSVSSAAGGIVSNILDLNTFFFALMNEQLISKVSINKMMDWLPCELDGHSGEYGLGLFKYDIDGFTAIGHMGDQPTGGGMLFYIPELDLYFSMVRNTDIKSDSPDLLAKLLNVISNINIEE